MKPEIKSNLILLVVFIIGWVLIFLLAWYLTFLGYPLYNAIALEAAPFYIAVQQLQRLNIIYFWFWLIIATWGANSFDFLLNYLFIMLSFIYIVMFITCTTIYRTKNMIFLS